MYLEHLTLTTGHTRRSERAEVGDGVLAIIAPWLLAAVNTGQIEPIPGAEAYGVRVVEQHGALVVTVYTPQPDIGERQPLVTLGVAQRSRHSAALWDQLLAIGQHKPGLSAPGTPWCAVHLHPPLTHHPDAAAWLGDFERCVAWAWITRRPVLETIKTR